MRPPRSPPDYPLQTAACCTSEAQLRSRGRIDYRSADRSTKDSHVVSTCNFSGVLRREAAAQHRGNELHPLRVVLHDSGGDLLISADADVVDSGDLGHFFEAIDVFLQTREEMPDSNRAPSLCDRPGVVAADLPAGEWSWTHRLRSRERGVRQQQRF